MKIGIIIQARMGSTRLPGKVLKTIGNKTLLEHIFFRLSMLKSSVEIIVATTDKLIDDQIVDYCKNFKVNCFRGDESHVLKRYYECAKYYELEHIIRLTADNPFIDIEELDNLIKLHISSQADYSRSFAVLPKGVGSEIFTFNALEESYCKGHKENHKEHVNEYIEENEELFKISELDVHESKKRQDLSLTVDTLEDYKKATYIVQKSKHDYILTEEAISLCLQYV